MKLTCLLTTLAGLFLFGALAHAQGPPPDEIKSLIQNYLAAEKTRDTAAEDKAFLALYADRAACMPVLMEKIGQEEGQAERTALLALFARMESRHDMEQDAALASLSSYGGLRREHFWMALVMSLALFAIIIDLVRRKLLRIEYSWLWVLTGVAILALVLTGALNLVASVIGARVPQTLFFSGVVFLTLINLHYSVAISRLSNQAKNLSQELAVLKHETEPMVKDAENRQQTK
jgi:hypothetical protein